MARPSNDDEPIVESSSADSAPNPVWFKPVMIGLMLLGLVWVLVFYISGMQFPIPGIDAWNLSTNQRSTFLPFNKYGKLVQMRASMDGHFMVLVTESKVSDFKTYVSPFKN